MKLLNLILVLILSSAFCYGQNEIGYDEFAQLDLAERVAVFNEVSPVNRAEIVREQAQRWLERNRSRLSDEQLEVYNAMLEFIRPDMYDGQSPEEENAINDLAKRLVEVFPQEDVRDSFTIEAPYLPPSINDEDPE